MQPTIVPFAPADRAWARSLLTDGFGAPIVVSRGVVHDATALPGFVARVDGRPAGLATYDVRGDECELVTINGPGVGAALLDAVVDR
ncbi:MAG TPA: hypothetical protein VF163_10145, partial [Micromonosporaceae bacterium]